MATLDAKVVSRFPKAANLTTEQAGNGQTTNIVDTGANIGPVLMKITTTVGATPTCTYAIEGSADGVDWWAVAYADIATPTTVSVDTFSITTETTAYKVVQLNQPYRFLRVTFSENTNVTNTVDVWTFAAGF